MTPREYAIKLLRDLKDPYFDIDGIEDSGDFLTVPDNYPYPTSRRCALLVGLKSIDDVSVSLSVAVLGALTDRANPERVLADEALYERSL